MRGRPHYGRTKAPREHHRIFHARMRVAGRLAHSVNDVLQRVDARLAIHRAFQVAGMHRIHELEYQFGNERRKAE